ELLSRQRRAWIIDTFSIEEENPGPFPYELGKINVDRIYRIHFDLFGEGADEEPKGVLSIHKETGMLIVHKAVDYEKNTMLRLRFEARNSDMSIYTKLGLEITIKDINDNPPRFQRDLYEIKVAEDESQLAYDRDMRGTPNSTFHYEIKSVFPNHPDTEFFVNESGAISFKGCLDHEVAEMFTVLVEAKDHGEAVSLSSSTTVVIHVQDGNNHLPVISGQTGSGKVKERESGTSPLRLHVTDKDSKNSSAWRAKYSIQGDEGEYFRIDTNPETNDGILTVVKPLDFEEAAQRQLSITVENEIPYFSCKVKDRTTSGLWKVDTSTSDGPVAGQPHTINVLIEVEDTNDPPVFNMTVKEAMLEENVPTGTWVEKVTAVDPDSPAGWLKVDPHTGDITTVRTPDRESPHVVNGLYTNPPKTGTATLNIHVTDQNDNVPRPTVDVMEFCISDRPTTKNITASDLDGTPFGAPFSFELLGDFEGKWTLNPSYEKGVVEYQPHLYADEEDLDTLSELENITVPDDDSFQKVLNELGPEFRQLAAICKPPHIQN
uniref:Cadherin domain-containing protein n=1 Tax=Mola mola TaxID=94237 RepID=A0A3Q3XIV5_MOLML